MKDVQQAIFGDEAAGFFLQDARGKSTGPFSASAANAKGDHTGSSMPLGQLASISVSKKLLKRFVVCRQIEDPGQRYFLFQTSIQLNVSQLHFINLGPYLVDPSRLYLR